MSRRKEKRGKNRLKAKCFLYPEPFKKLSAQSFLLKSFPVEQELSC